MAAKTWILTDVSEAKHHDELQIDRRQFPADVPDGVAILKLTLHGGLSEGVEEIRVNNGRFQFSVLPTRGMGLWKGWLDGQTLGWKSPVRGPVHPHYVPLHEPSGLGWLSGFDEWICRCGAFSNGAPDFNEQGQLTHPLHGHLANLPAEYVEVSIEGDQISVRGIVREARFHFQKLQLTTTITTRVNQPGLEIHDQLKNLSGSEAEMQMLYHCNFGPPLLGSGAEIAIPAETVVPRNAWAAESVGHWSTFSEPAAGIPERVYLVKPCADQEGETRVLLKNPQARRGVSLTWNVAQLPYFTLWKNETALNDGYVTGLEPGTNFPNPRQFETQHNRLVRLAPGATHEMRIGFSYHESAAAVEQAEAAVKAIQGDRAPELFDQPQPTWCA